MNSQKTRLKEESERDNNLQSLFIYLSVMSTHHHHHHKYIWWWWWWPRVMAIEEWTLWACGPEHAAVLLLHTYWPASLCVYVCIIFQFHCVFIFCSSSVRNTYTHTHTHTHDHHSTATAKCIMQFSNNEIRVINYPRPHCLSLSIHHSPSSFSSSSFFFSFLFLSL